MANGPGRDQRVPMERLVRIAAMLQAHPQAGVSAERLNQVAGFPESPGHDQLKRDIRHLENQGWRIENISPPGTTAVYRMSTVDNRLRVRLSLTQQAALRRAVMLADGGDLVQRLGLSADPADRTNLASADGAPAAVGIGAPPALRLVIDAVRDRRVLHFDYKGSARMVHPESVRNQNSVWYLRGVEDADLSTADQPVLKTFVVSRMNDVGADDPGTARSIPPVRHAGLHPMSWEMDPPVDVTLRAAADFEPDVRRWLGEPSDVEIDGADVLMSYRVTNRAALHARLVELDDRVRVEGPEQVRDAFVAFLVAARGGEEAR